MIVWNGTKSTQTLCISIYAYITGRTTVYMIIQKGNGNVHESGNGLKIPIIMYANAYTDMTDDFTELMLSS